MIAIPWGESCCGGPDDLARAVQYLSGTPDVRVQVESEYARDPADNRKDEGGDE